MSIQRWLNMPWRAASTASPALSVLESAVSHPPVAVDGKTNTSASWLFSTVFTPASAGWRICANSGER
ncbi:hypothetical protein ABIC20_006895 [Methylobacterium radiotolerans]|uniref:Uncharacterized protein n=1 Tax=Methylobacterium radiotolerans TaxID=31998 RepID=A0ABV2NSJ8_9HYPH